MIEWNISLGNIITFVTVMGGVMWVALSMRADLRVMQAELRIMGTRLQAVETVIIKLTDVLIGHARQEERMKAIDQRLRELSGRPGTTLQD